MTNLGEKLLRWVLNIAPIENRRAYSEQWISEIPVRLTGAGRESKRQAKYKLGGRPGLHSGDGLSPCERPLQRVFAISAPRFPH